MTDRWTSEAALASVRHDLLAPANAIAGYADLLIEDAPTSMDADLLDDLQRIQDASRTLLSLADELLSADRITAMADQGGDQASIEARVRHDLRNPLSAIRGYGEMMLEELDDSNDESLGELSEDLRHLLESTDALLDQLEAIVDFSGDGGAGRDEDLDLQAMAAELAESIRPSDRSAHDQVEPGRILLVEDNESNRALLARRLEKAGHTVVQASDGQEALDALAREEGFDLVLLDLMMPGINGFEILMRIKRNPSLRYLPVIMISALREMGSIVRCIEAGADDYLPKPVNNTLLFARLDASLARKQAQDRERRYLERIEEEKAKSESLLRNILPETIVERLHRGETVTADQFDEVTVVFTDIVGFTRLSSRTAPRDMVSRLNRLFSAFDRLTHEHGVEKIKTIGDAYMAAAGLPEPCEDHARRAARLALGMQEAVARINRDLPEPFAIRVGMHSGPVAAGILGTHKFVYDIWGDTVNLASRLESSAQPSTICLSAETRDCLAGRFRTESLGERELKGKGRVAVHRLIAEEMNGADVAPANEDTP